MLSLSLSARPTLQFPVAFDLGGLILRSPEFLPVESGWDAASVWRLRGDHCMVGLTVVEWSGLGMSVDSVKDMENC